ncbi:MAG: molybdopterin-binding protein [Chloroflexales bacterium]|nr:molybdopterin-binding protein [Chloroflexales bacterium]
MHLYMLPIEETVGHILCHNLADTAGRKAFAKGHIVKRTDLPRLRELGLCEIRVAILDPNDVYEDEAAQRLATAIAGTGSAPTKAHTGRVNLRASCNGPLVIDEAALLAINDLDGLTVATLRHHTMVRTGQIVATIKVIPFAVPEERLAQAEAIGKIRGSVLCIRPLQVRHVGVILVSSLAAQQRVKRGVYRSVADRVSNLDAEVAEVRYVTPDEESVATAIRELQALSVGLVIIAGETSIMDHDDVTPQGIRLAGGRIEHYGAPVEPGNLLLLAYLDSAAGEGALRHLPILGAPGCVRSRSANIVDMLLPRLMAGEMVGRTDIIALGHGGLLE